MQKLYKTPKNTYYIVVSFNHSSKLLTLASLMCMPSGVISNPKKVVVFGRNLHFFRFEYNICLHKYMGTFCRSIKCSFAVLLQMSNSSRKTTTPLSSLSTNRLFIVCKNIVGVFVRPIRIKTNSYYLYWVRYTIFSISTKLYSISNTHCKDSKIKNTLHFLICQSSLHFLAVDMNP